MKVYRSRSRGISMHQPSRASFMPESNIRFVSYGTYVNRHPRALHTIVSKRGTDDNDDNDGKNCTEPVPADSRNSANTACVPPM